MNLNPCDTMKPTCAFCKEDFNQILTKCVTERQIVQLFPLSYNDIPHEKINQYLTNIN